MADLLNPLEVREKAKKNFTDGCNCSQAVLCTFVDVLGEEKMGMNRTQALHLSSSFGGGMGRLREVCGSVSGMFMTAGILYGYDESSGPEAKTQHYELIQKMARLFAEKNGSIVCRELLGMVPKKTSFQPDSPVPEARTESYYKKRPCAEFVGDAAEIMCQIINEKGL